MAGAGLYEAFSDGYPLLTGVPDVGGGPDGGAYAGASPGLKDKLSASIFRKRTYKNLLSPLRLARCLVHVEPSLVIRIKLFDPSGEFFRKVAASGMRIGCLHYR